MITLTPEAQAKVSSMLNDAGEGNSLRIFIEPGGCSGFEYGMSIDSPKDKDHLDTISDLPVAVCPDSYDYIKGSEIHFDDGLSGKGFEIRNPNAESTCGCGKSFR
jgi:iron-sulfur cluster assembly accessory protein